MQISKIKNLLIVCGIASLVSACGDTSNLGAIHDTFEAKPTNFDEMMTEANKCASSNKTERALYWYQQAIAAAETEYGPNDARVANAAMYDASLARSLNKLGEAEKMYKRAYEINCKIFPPTSPQLNQIKQAYAETLVQNYKLDEARKIYPAVKTPSDSLKGHGKAKKH